MNTISINFNKNLPATNGIEILLEASLKESEYAWVWDNYFSLVLNKLLASNAEELLTLTSRWAIEITKKLKTPANLLEQQGLLYIAPIPAYHQMTETEIEIYINLTPQSDTLPAIHARLPDDITEKQLSYSPIALANFFLNENKHFYKELPLHILSMKKYYLEQSSFTNVESINSAPIFAFNMAMQFQKSLTH